MAWYAALVRRWQGAVAVEAWVLPGGGVASFAAGGVVAVVDCCVAVDVVVGVGRVRERERA